MKIQEIETILKNTSYENLRSVCQSFSSDERKGVQNLIHKYEKKLEDYIHELERLDQMMFYERKYASYGLVSGIDEAGRGPLAGPVVASCVILPTDRPILYVNDSKKLSAKKREELFDIIQKEAVAYGIGIISNERIDEINILQATYEAMRQAIGQISVQIGCCLNDAVTIPEIEIHQVPIIKGDAKSASIAAASILAKVTRDRLMLEQDALYPEYGFKNHKGYGSAEHIAALKKYGPCPIHRRTFIGGILGNQ